MEPQQNYSPNPQQNSVPKSNTVAIVVTICITAIILGLGYLYFTRSNQNSFNIQLPSQENMVLGETYNGAWEVEATPVNTKNCAPARATVSVNNGIMTGTLITTTGVQATLGATVDAEGRISPGVTTNSAMFVGQLGNTDGSGTWTDAYGCQGTFTMKKTDTSVNSDTQVQVGQLTVSSSANAKPATTANNKVVVTTQTNTTAAKPATTNGVTGQVVAGGVTIAGSYSGNWNGKAINTTPGFCQNYTITGTVSNGYLSGLAKGDTLGDISKFEASVSADGTIGIGRGGQLVRFTGKINGTTATGQWVFTENSGSNCAGNFTFTKTN